MNWLRQRLGDGRWIALLALLTALVWLALRGLPDGRLHVYFLDVGQGDAIFIRTPDGRQILIDGGPSPTALLSELGDLMPFWDRSLDLVVLTHPDRDHLTGLLVLLDRYRIAQVLDTAQSDVLPQAASWREYFASAAVPRAYAQRGMRLEMGNVKFAVLNPAGDNNNTPDTGGNNLSIVLHLSYEQISFLLTGDAEQLAETAMLTAGLPLHADVLKVAHHGSGGGTSASFVVAVNPRLAVIQVGADNAFGHPHAETLQHLAGIQVLRTDQDGRIEVASDGKRLWVQTTRHAMESGAK